MSQSLPLLNNSRIANANGLLAPPFMPLPENTTDIQRAGPLAGPPVCAENVIVAVTDKGTLCAFETTNFGEIWRHNAQDWHGPDRSALILGATVVTSNRNSWTLRDLQTGDITAHFDASAIRLGCAVADGTALIGPTWQDGPYLTRIETQTGTAEWSVPLDGHGEPVTTLTGRTLACSTKETQLDARDVTSGDMLWSLDVSDIGVQDLPFAAPHGVINGWPVAAGGHIIVPVRVGHWVALDPATGSERWRTTVDTFAPGTAVFTAPERLLILGDTHTAVIELATGSVVSSALHNQIMKPDFLGAPVASAEYAFAVGTYSGQLVAFDLTNGACVWSSSTGGATPPTYPPLLCEAGIVTTDLAGNIRIFCHMTSTS